MSTPLPIAVWMPPRSFASIPFLVDTPPSAPPRPRVFGSSGFGPEVFEVSDFSVEKVSTGIILVGRPGGFRSRMKVKLVDAFRSQNPGASVVYCRGGEEAKTYRASRAVSRWDPPYTPLLVVVEHEGGRDDVLAEVLDHDGEYGVSTLVVTGPDFLPTTRYSSLSFAGNLRVVVEAMIVLENVEPSPAAGVAIRSALEEGVCTPAGVEAVIDGSPVEWVRSFEAGQAQGGIAE